MFKRVFSNKILIITIVILSALILLLVGILFFIELPSINNSSNNLNNNKASSNVNENINTETPSETDSSYLSPFGAMEAGVGYVPIRKGGTPSFKEAAEMGVKWSRAAISDFTGDTEKDYNFEINDRIFKSANDAGILNYVYNINVAQFARGNHTWMPKAELVNQYINWVKYVVEYYDGDGNNDMPDLKYPVKYWQIDNEPDVNLELSDTPSTYADLLKISYEAIKEADPDAKVLCGGISQHQEFYYQVFEKYHPQRYFDIFDYHYYGMVTGDYRNFEKGVNKIKAYFNEKGWPEVSIWSTEMGSYSGEPPGLPFQSETQQAGDYVKRWVHGISVNVPVIFGAWWLKENWLDPFDSVFHHTGLIFNGQYGNDRGENVKKIGYYSYQVMAEKLEGLIFQEMTELADDAFSYRFLNTSTGKSTYVVWWDGYQEGTSKSIDFSGINGSTIRITDAITDYNGNRTTNLMNIQGGNVSLQLEAYHPLFIEVAE